jgi:hypothetical protein
LFIRRSFMVSTSRENTFMVEDAETEAPITTRSVDGARCWSAGIDPPCPTMSTRPPPPPRAPLLTTRSYSATAGSVNVENSQVLSVRYMDLAYINNFE